MSVENNLWENFKKSFAACLISPTKSPKKKLSRHDERLDMDILKRLEIEWTDQDKRAVQSQQNAPNESWWLTDAVIYNKNYILDEIY